MPLPIIETYYNISEKRPLFARIFAEEGRNAAFIVPSGLDKELMLEMVSDGGSFVGRAPDIWTWSDLYRRICTKCGEPSSARRVIDPPDHHLIISHILDLYIERAERAGLELPPGVRQRGFVSLLGRNMKDLLNEEIMPELISETLISDEDAFSAERLLRDIYLDYVNYLEKYGLADTAQIATLTREALAFEGARKFVSQRRFVITGFLSFTGGQVKLLRTLFDLAKCTAVLPETGLDTFHDGIKQIGSEYEKRPEWSVGAVRLIAGNSQLQFDALAREFALWMTGRGDLKVLGGLESYGDIGVQVRPEYLKSAQNSFERYKIPVSLRVRESVADTLFGALPRLIWNAYESGWKTRDTMVMLSNPLWGCTDFDSSVSDMFPEGSDGWRSVLKGRALEVFGRIELLCGALAEGGTPAHIMSLWLGFVKEFEMSEAAASVVGDVISLDQSVRDIGYSIRALENKTLMLDDLTRGIGPASEVKLAGGSAVSFLTDWAAAAQLQTRLPQSGALSLYAGSVPVLASHKYWVMTDIDYSTCPGNLRESPLLGNDEKRQLNESMDGDGGNVSHIPEIHEEREQKEALFRRLAATAENAVIISRSAVDRSGRPVGSSPFADSLFASKDPKRSVKAVKDVKYPLSRVLPREGDEFFPRAEVLLKAPKSDRGSFPRTGKADGEDRPTISLSSLDDWVLCPYLYWCRKKLRLERPSDGLYDPLSAGTYLHALWEESRRHMPETGGDFIATVQSLKDKLMEIHYPELRDDPRLKIFRTGVEIQIDKMAGLLDAIDSRIDLHTEDADFRSELEYTLPDFELNGAVFRGRCDRVDFYGKEAVVLDYKLGRSENYKQQLQLAAYCAVLKETGLAEPKGYGWLGHADAALAGYFESGTEYSRIYRGISGKRAGKSFAELMDEALKAMADMAESVRSGNYPANYAARRGSSNFCPRCDFRPLCRQSESPFAMTQDEKDGKGDTDYDD